MEVGTIPDMPNIHNILPIVEHRFGLQSGLDGSAGQKSTIVLHGITFRVYLMFSKTNTNLKKQRRLTEI